MNRYSIDFVPETPEGEVLKLLVTFGSYNSKPSGNLITGFFINFMFPLPAILSFNVTASLALVSVAVILEFSEKCPTVPLNEAGLLAVGKAFTVTFTAGAVMYFETLVYESKKSSNILRTA